MIAAIQPPAQQVASNQAAQSAYFDTHNIGALIVGLIVGLAVGLVMGWYGHWLTTRREAAGRRRIFRDFIAVLDEEFAAEWKRAEIMDTNDFPNWAMLASHYASVPRVKAEATKIREDVKWWNRRGFRGACADYYHFGVEVNFESNHAKFERIRKESQVLLRRLRRYAS